MIKLNFVLSEKHLKNVCKIGSDEKACRYLSTDRQAPRCVKFTPDAVLVDNSKPDNCNAILDEIIERKKDFIGKSFIYKEINPDIEKKGIVVDLFSADTETFTIVLREEENSWSETFYKDSLLIISTDKYLSFQINGAGLFTGIIKIYFV